MSYEIVSFEKADGFGVVPTEKRWYARTKEERDLMVNILSGGREVGNIRTIPIPTGSAIGSLADNIRLTIDTSDEPLEDIKKMVGYVQLPQLMSEVEWNTREHFLRPALRTTDDGYNGGNGYEVYLLAQETDPYGEPTEYMYVYNAADGSVDEALRAELLLGPSKKMQIVPSEESGGEEA